ncbi:glycosyltransferase [Candidatus Pelagibacter sp.]|nr:glycosyltransferase [Candidatus Pelagibacter sp.]
MYSKKKVRLFIFQPYPKFGGADRSIIKLINGLNFDDITLISLSKCYYSRYLNKKIQYKILKSSRTLYCIFELKKFIQEKISEKNSKKNIIISNQNFANIVTIISLEKITEIKKILIERNHLDELRFYKNIKDYIKKKIMLILIKIYYSKSDAVVGISRKLSVDLENFINSKVTTIYNPSLEDKIIRNNIEKKLEIKKNKKIILNVGFFEKQKDQITILKSISILKNHYKNFLLILIGRGSEYNNLKKFIRENNLNKFVKIYKNIENPKLFYKKADLFILSSIYEGLGNVLVEALKNNCPVITSSCNSGPMEIIGNGKYGDFFLPRDHKTLAKKILNHFHNPERLKKKLKIPLNHLEKFSLKKNIGNFSELFRKV